LKTGKSKIRQIADKHLNKILILIVLVIFFIPISNQCRIQNRFGIIVSSPELGGRFTNRCEVIMLIAVDSGEAFYNAGFKSGDVLLDTVGHFSIQGFIKTFDQPPGTEIWIKSIPHGDSASNCTELFKMKQVTRRVVAP
jgi:hypothetical protein